MSNCEDCKPCVNCYSDQGLCIDKVKLFLKELTELTLKHDLIISVDANSGLMFLHEQDKEYMYCEGYREVIKGSGRIEWCDV